MTSCGGQPLIIQLTVLACYNRAFFRVPLISGDGWRSVIYGLHDLRITALSIMKSRTIAARGLLC